MEIIASLKTTWHGLLLTHDQIGLNRLKLRLVAKARIKFNMEISGEITNLLRIWVKRKWQKEQMLNSKYTNSASFIGMSKGLGKVERFILETLGETGPCSVSLLSNKYCRSCRVRFDKPSGKMLYHSVARAVRSLERKKIVKARKVPLKELHPEIKKRHMWNNHFYPVYIKLVYYADEPEF